MGIFSLFFFYLGDMDVVNGGVKFGRDWTIDDRMASVDVRHVWSERCENVQINVFFIRDQ